jgi:peptidoglycan/LPS O-acetylase OafA/YrhL
MENSNRAFGLDITRAAASLMVAIAHGLLYLSSINPILVGPGVFFATLGVEIFFVLSGFLIAPSLLAVCRGELRARRFWVRRAWRTLPVYYIFFGVNVALYFAIAPERPPSAAFLVFSQSLLTPLQYSFFVESWSLAVEVWFYLLASIAAALSARFDKRLQFFLWLLAALILLSLALRALWAHINQFPWDSGMRKLTWLRLDAIALGVASRVSMPTLLRSSCWLYFGVLLIVGASLYIAHLGTLGLTEARLSNVTDALLGSLALTCSSLGVALSLPSIQKIDRTYSVSGTVFFRLTSSLAHSSYALYLCHFPLLIITIAIIKQTGLVSVAPITFALCFWFSCSLFCAWMFHRYIEQRILALRDKYHP